MRADESFQQMVVIGQGAGQARCVHGTGSIFQVPVTAQVGVSGGINRGGHVSPGKRGQGFHKGGAGVTFGYTTPVKQKVALRIQRLAPGRQIVTAAGQLLAGDKSVTEADTAGVAVGKKMNRVKILVSTQNFRNLFNPVALAVQQINVQQRIGGRTGLSLGLGQVEYPSILAGTDDGLDQLVPVS
ncbi:MAG: hypothetical protein R6T87_12080, partial [Marinobacter sp.]